MHNDDFEFLVVFIIKFKFNLLSVSILGKTWVNIVNLFAQYYFE